ncbi:hypothetical protein [Saccharibacillus sp. JS10]|uniref:hypothetical protein n=1 Tax=Saccharibacillus sp. JS10 TaxID=2950552 RepID=UPI00210C8EB0|nr:hypothetical protein [Saccharibacillus sp. JS10]MCQ4088407.1 hypothetical protein [Saccharibacillus sp. JS10]
MEFSYKLNSIGWADVHLKIGKSEIYMSPSYLSEPLIDLVRSIEILLPECTPEDEVKKSIEFEWDSEPAIHNWKIERKSEEQIQIVITYYEDGIKKNSGQVEFQEVCDLNMFIFKIVNILEDLLKNHGLVGYRKQWYAQDFPISSYLQLKYVLTHQAEFPLTTINPNEWNQRIDSKLTEELRLINQVFEL